VSATATLYEQQQRPHRYSPKAESDPAMKMIGSLAAAAVLLAPHDALVNARLPPEDFGIVFAPVRFVCDKGLHWLRQHL